MHEKHIDQLPLPQDFKTWSTPNHKATQNKNYNGTTALERWVA